MHNDADEGFSLAREAWGRTFKESFPARVFFFLFLFFFFFRFFFFFFSFFSESEDQLARTYFTVTPGSVKSKTGSTETTVD